MLRFGNISEIDTETGRARVSFGEDGIVSPWMPMVVSKTKGDQYSHSFEIKEQVACLMDNKGRTGVILGAIYSDEYAPTSDAAEGVVVVNFQGGSSVKFDRNTNKMEITASGGVAITGDLSVSGAVSAVSVDASADVTAGPLNTSLSTHTHPGVTTGTGSTGTPV